MLISISAIIFLFSKSLAEDSICGDWKAYKDEKCIKVFDETLVNFDDAIKLCVQNDSTSTLAIIKSKEEQDFITNFIFNEHKVADNVWIGIKNLSNKFTGIDKSEITFSNWAQSNPQNESGYNCVQMVPERSSLGIWFNEPCNRKNAVVCQKLQSWSLIRLQGLVLDDRKQMRDSINELQLQLKNQEKVLNELKEENKNQVKELNTLKQNPLPKGFIYAQLPGQDEPKIIWPTVSWFDVSSTYAGLFFRVVGGNSAGFGTVQEANTTMLTSIRWQINTNVNKNNLSHDSHFISINGGQWSDYIPTGNINWSIGPDVLQLYVSDGEIRPKNHAIKIWKRS